MEEKNEAFFIQHHYDRLFKTIEDEWRKKMNRFSIQHHYDRLFKTIEDEWRKK